MTSEWLTRISIVALAVLLLGVAFVSAGRTPQADPVEVATPSAVNRKTEHEQLQHCQLMAEPDDACRRLWAENRRRFITLRHGEASDE